MCNNNDGSCIAEVLTVICILQQNANSCDSCLDTCDRGFLGCNTSCMTYNTRPIMIYTCCGNGVPFSMPISKDPDEQTKSSIFRVEKIDGNCATFRVLARNEDTSELICSPYVATNSFFTMNLSCICAIRCLNDCFVECI
ncbi:MAG: CotY/CotZ family spore coat protein [Bacilli bacterium]|nr:CotY/CotZ family spore coat protein [Bacilli bacterium]